MGRESMISRDRWIAKQGISYKDHSEGMVSLADTIRGCTTDLENKIWNIEYKISKVEKMSLDYHQKRAKDELQASLKWDKKIDLTHARGWIADVKKIASLPFLKGELLKLKAMQKREQQLLSTPGGVA